MPQINDVEHGQTNSQAEQSASTKSGNYRVKFAILALLGVAGSYAVYSSLKNTTNEVQSLKTELDLPQTINLQENSLVTECNIRQRLTADGQCQNCDDYESTGEDKSVCQRPNCDFNQYTSVTGFCQVCPEYQIADELETGCEPPKCDEGQVILPTGKCLTCPSTYQSEFVRYICECKRYDVIYEGQCFNNCPIHTVLGPDNITCQLLDCGRREKRQVDGSCGLCPDYLQAAENKIDCEEPKCSYRQITMPDATCQNCPAYQVRSSSGNQCVSLECGAQQKVLPNGQCEDCPDYFTIISSKFQCERRQCLSREFLSQEGVCQTCPDYLVPDRQQRSCIEVDCGFDNFRVMKDGACELCPPYTTSKADNTQCQPPQCRYGERMVDNGSCVRCDDYYQPTPDLKDCEPLAGGLLVQKILELEAANQQETTEKVKYQKQNDALQSVVRDQAQDKQLFASKNDQCIIEKDQLSQANKILYEQCQNDKQKISSGVSELEKLKNQLFQEGISSQKAEFDEYLIDQRSKLQKMIKARSESINTQKYEIFLDASSNFFSQSIDDGKNDVDGFVGFDTTKGSCGQGTITNVYDKRIVSYKTTKSTAQLTIAGYYCKNSKYFLQEGMTTDKCKDIVLQKKEEGVCDTDYFYWDTNERNQDDCFCCVGQDIEYASASSYNTYQILIETEPVYQGGIPQISNQQKAEMGFCQRLCENDDNCQAFEYDFNNPGNVQNCKTFSFNGYTGNGNEQAICFTKNYGNPAIVPEVIDETVTVEEADTDTVEELAQSTEELAASSEPIYTVELVVKKNQCKKSYKLGKVDKQSPESCMQAGQDNQNRCANGEGFFTYNESNGDCLCCTDSGNATSSTKKSSKYNIYQTVKTEIVEPITAPDASSSSTSATDITDADINTTNDIIDNTDITWIQDGEDVSKIDISMIREQSYCVDNLQLSLGSDTLNECAQKVDIEKRCFDGSDFFFYRETDRMCSCCVGPSPPLENTGLPFYSDVNLYKRNSGLSACKESSCANCLDDGKRCAECLPEFRLIMGACFSFN